MVSKAEEVLVWSATVTEDLKAWNIDAINVHDGPEEGTKDSLLKASPMKIMGSLLKMAKWLSK